MSVTPVVSPCQTKCVKNVPTGGLFHTWNHTADDDDLCLESYRCSAGGERMDGLLNEKKATRAANRNPKTRLKMQRREKISGILIWAPFKDIAFSLLFLRCCLSFLSFLISLSRAWTPAAETRLGSDQRARHRGWTFGYKRWR